MMDAEMVGEMGGAMVDVDDEGRWGSDAHDDHIEIVAAPLRYPRSPLVALLVVAFVPTIALIVLLRWSDSEADRYEDSRAAVALLQNRLDGGLGSGDEVSTTVDDALDEIEGGAPVLTTAVFDYRRVSTSVASIAQAARLRVAVDPLFSFLGPQSCAAVSIDGVAVTSINLDSPVVPASNQKLLVATTALDVLGPDYRFTTSVAVPRAVDGVIDGDIYLIGGGDPLLTSDDYPVDDDRLPVTNPTSLSALADALVDAGITRINGTVIGDGSRYDDEFFVEEWADGVAFNEAGPYDALLANDARVRGRSGVQDDPNAAAAREFARLLSDRGIRVNNGWGSGVASTLVPVLASVESAPLSDVVGEMLLNSDNNTAEMLLKEIGFVASNEGTRAAGLNAMYASLERLGVPMDGVAVRDGSGLSNRNRVTCAAILDVVHAGAGGPIDDGLPIASFNGTLSDEFAESEMVGRLRAKTGTLTGVKALAGYVDAPNGADAGPIEFVLILNRPTVEDPSVYQPVWEELGNRFATYPGGPTADSLGPR